MGENLKDSEILKIYEVNHKRKIWSFIKLLFFIWACYYTANLAYTGDFPQNLKWADNIVILAIGFLAYTIFICSFLLELIFKKLTITKKFVVIDYSFFRIKIADKNSKLIYLKPMFILSPTLIGFYNANKSIMVRAMTIISISTLNNFDITEFINIMKSQKGLEILEPIK